MSGKILRAVLINIVVFFTIVKQYNNDETAFVLAVALLPLTLMLLYKRLE